MNASRRINDAQFAKLARTLLGEPNEALSSDNELRYGNHGSLSVDLKKGLWFDHEIGEGGGPFELVAREKNLTGAALFEWLREQGYAFDSMARRSGSSLGSIVASYDYVAEDGTLLFQVCRFDPKDFRQRRKARPDDPRDKVKDGWVWSVRGIKQIPYRLPDLLKNQDRVICICEGERDVDNLWKLGVPATCNAGGAGKWRDELTEFFHDADCVVIPDRDPQKKHPKTGALMFHPDGRPVLPGQDHAQEVARSLSAVARVRVLELWQSWPDMPMKGDVSDWLKHGGTAEQLYALIKKLPDWEPPGEETTTTAEQAKPEQDETATAIENEITRLAALPELKYEQERKSVAEGLGVRASILDRLVQGERTRLGLDGDDAGMQGRSISFSEPEPWPEPVDGAALFDEISKAIKSHIVMPQHSGDTCALWTAHTFLLDCTMISPRLAITSPVRGCGKTTTLDVISQLVLRPLPAANVSASAVFRVVEGYRPCLMVDEADSFLKDDNELRGILNSGHRRGGQVLRNVGDDHEPRSFSTYGACAIALIGRLPGTLADRSVPITLTRRKKDEDITPFRLDRVDHLVILARKLARWTSDNTVTVGATEPDDVPGIYNRQADNWRPLLAIAQVAGGDWLARAQKAALASVAADIDDAALLELLLEDIRTIFTGKALDRISSTLLADLLAEIEGRPWAEYGRSEKPITPGKIARLLKPLAIMPENIRVVVNIKGKDEDKVLKGYVLERFTEAFARYLGPEGVSKPLQRYNADETGTSEPFQAATAEPDVADRKREKPANDGACSVVAVRKAGQGEEQDICAHCGQPGANKATFGDGRTVWLHRQCETPYRRVAGKP